MAGSPKKRAKRLGLDPLDEPGPGSSVARKRPELSMEPVRPEPHNKVRLSDANRERVIRALLDGYPRAAIARALGISTPTLRRLMADDREMLDAVEAQRSFEEAELRDILMELARKGDTVAAIFLAKARHGWRDRDDAKLKLETEKGGGVLVVPGISATVEDWEAEARDQQARFRTRNPETDPAAPGADRLRAAAQRGSIRTRTLLPDGLAMERTQPGDLPR
ncbi:helix-turn-helix domain-containing protein [Sphingosinicella humi]|nr:helix-turn-helix domain-containing protein [Sphingosinicella humi]